MQDRGTQDRGTGDSFDVARSLRAVRRGHRLSQRELATSAGVPASTVAEIEAGRRIPGVALFARLVAAGGYGLTLVSRDETEADVTLDCDDAHDAVRDRGGRRLPAHLEWGGKPDYWTMTPPWWGWSNIAWYRSDDPAGQSRPRLGPPDPPPAWPPPRSRRRR